VALLVATAGGAGYSPWAPGTCGTLVAVPLAYALFRAGLLAYALGTLVVIAVGAWAAGRVCRLYQAEDVQLIVIDEVAGYLVTVAPVVPTWWHLLVGFGLFRLFDIVKPWPVSWADRRVHGGLGVMLDDLLAGLYAGLVLWGADRLGLLRWVLDRVHGAG
jgi:phosphatidylglycerophosphatase A